MSRLTASDVPGVWTGHHKPPKPEPGPGPKKEDIEWHAELRGWCQHCAEYGSFILSEGHDTATCPECFHEVKL